MRGYGIFRKVRYSLLREKSFRREAMKWQQRVRVATGLSCWQIMLHILVVAVLVMGWMSGALVRVGLGLCVLYGVTVLSMLFLQRHHEARWRGLVMCWKSSPPPGISPR
jgi:hypothetical protein